MDHKREHRAPPLARIMGVGRQQQPTSCIVQPIGAHGGEVMYFGCFWFRGELGFLDCDDICMCYELYNEISLTFTPGSVFLCSHVVALGLTVRLSRYRMWVQ